MAVQRSYFYLLLYVSFFPQLIAGPIVRYQTVEHEIRERREKFRYLNTNRFAASSAAATKKTAFLRLVSSFQRSISRPPP